MLIPILGHVGSTPLDISGQANSKGFELKIIDRYRGRLLNFATKHYSESKSTKLTKKEWIAFLSGLVILISGLSSIFSLIDRHLFDSLIPCIIFNAGVCITLLLSAVYLIGLFKHRNKKNKDIIEWHACEHKSLALLSARLQPTIENLRMCPSVSICCGTVMFGLGLEALILLLITVGGIAPGLAKAIIAAAIIYGTGVAILFAPILLGTWLWELISKKKEAGFGIACLVTGLLMLPYALLPLLLQKLFTVKEPSKEKLKTTAKELRQFINARQLYKIKNPVK